MLTLPAIGRPRAGCLDMSPRRQTPRRAPVLALAMKPFAAMAAVIDRIGAGLVRSFNASERARSR